MSAEERRERRGFEPPPWEKEQFEEYERLQRDEAPRDQEETKVSDPSSADDEPAGSGTGNDTGPEASVSQAAVAGGDIGTDEVVVGSTAPGIDSARMAELLVGLKAEEPSPDRYWKLGLAVAAFLAVLGSVMLIWGIVAMQATRGSGGQLAWMGAAVLMAFGVGFIAIAGWVAYKNLQRQGVL